MMHGVVAADTCTVPKVMRVSGEKSLINTHLCSWRWSREDLRNGGCLPLKILVRDDLFLYAARAWSPSWWLDFGQNLVSSFQSSERVDDLDEKPMSGEDESIQRFNRSEDFLDNNFFLETIAPWIAVHENTIWSGCCCVLRGAVVLPETFPVWLPSFPSFSMVLFLSSNPLPSSPLKTSPLHHRICYLFLHSLTFKKLAFPIPFPCTFRIFFFF